MLTKYRPKNDLFDIFDFGFFPTSRSVIDHESTINAIAPRTNINELDDSYVFSMEMPGVAKGKVELTVEGDTLTVKGEKIVKVETKGLIRREIRAEKFERSFTLGTDIDRDKVTAKMADGVLTVTLQKLAEQVGRKISVA